MDGWWMVNRRSIPMSESWVPPAVRSIGRRFATVGHRVIGDADDGAPGRGRKGDGVGVLFVCRGKYQRSEQVLCASAPGMPCHRDCRTECYASMLGRGSTLAGTAGTPFASVRFLPKHQLQCRGFFLRFGPLVRLFSRIVSHNLVVSPSNIFARLASPSFCAFSHRSSNLEYSPTITSRAGAWPVARIQL